MNKNDTIAELKKLGIPHDEKGSAENLSALLNAVTSNTAKAKADAEGKVVSLEQELEKAKAKKSEKARSSEKVDARLAELVSEKRKAGLTKDQAIAAAKAQVAHDADLGINPEPSPAAGE